MTVTRTYTDLKSIPKAKIERCIGRLPNRLQCWRAADMLCTETSVLPADIAKKQSEVKTERSWQLCFRHAIAEKEAFEKEQQQNVNNTK